MNCGENDLKSILQKSNKCIVCGTTLNLEEHHVFYGSFRRSADRYGLTVRLCGVCHRGNSGVHFNTDLDLKLKKAAQTRFESIYGHDKYMRIFRKNYLEE